MRYKRLVIGAVVAALVGVTVWFYNWSQAPAVSTTSQTENHSETPSEKLQPLLVATDQFTTYTQNMTIQPVTDPKGAGVLARVIAVSSAANTGDKLAITVANLPSDGLTGVSDVNFRAHTPERYVKVEDSGLPQGAIAFRALDGYEYSIFWPNGGRYAAIVLSGRSDRRSNLDTSIQYVVDRWQWL